MYTACDFPLTGCWSGWHPSRSDGSNFRCKRGPPPLFSLLCILQTPSSSFQKLGHPNRRRPSTFWRRDAGVERIGRRNRSECDLSSIPVLFSLFYTQTGWSREATVRMTKKRKERERERESEMKEKGRPEKFEDLGWNEEESLSFSVSSFSLF